MHLLSSSAEKIDRLVKNYLEFQSEFNMKKKKLTHSVEDYLEMIFLISKEKKEVRITDIAQRMKVRKSSIVAAVKKLCASGYLVHEHYGYILMTDTGKNLAKEVYRKHKILKDFFLDILSLPEDIAEKDACNIEHYISDQTVRALVKLAEELHKHKKNQ